MTGEANNARPWSAAISLRGLALVWVPIALVTAAHFGVGGSEAWAHGVLRRLYYLPIVLAAFSFGRRGALLASVVVSLAYAPHAFGTMHYQADPGSTVEKILEIALYNVMAVVTGTLADRERRERLAQQSAAVRLTQSLEELQSMEAQLVRAGQLRALGELTAGLAHEIRNPLASIQGSVEILADEIRPDSPRRPMVEILRKEIARLNALLGRFLAFARPAPSQTAPVPLREIVDPVIELLSAEAEKRGVHFVVELATEPPTVTCDREQMTAVLMNVLLNGVQAAGRDGKVFVRTGASLRGRREYVTLDVEDTGPGVPKELGERIFDPFVTTKEEGTGLGLAIAARVLDAHHGFIEVTSGDHGTLFRLWLPRDIAVTPPVPPADPRHD